MKDTQPTLLSWLITQELTSHNLAVKHRGYTKGLECSAQVKVRQKVIDKVQKMKKENF
jgi:hypothetical protein